MFEIPHWKLVRSEAKKGAEGRERGGERERETLRERGGGGVKGRKVGLFERGWKSRNDSGWLVLGMEGGEGGGGEGGQPRGTQSSRLVGEVEPGPAEPAAMWCIWLLSKPSLGPVHDVLGPGLRPVSAAASSARSSPRPVVQNRDGCGLWEAGF